MNPATFPESNTVFTAPSDMDESQVLSIPAYAAGIVGGNLDGAHMVIVAWRPSPDEIRRLADGGLVYLSMIGGLAPHFITTDFKEAINVV